VNIDILSSLGKSRKEKNPNGATVQLDPAQKNLQIYISKRPLARVEKRNFENFYGKLCPPLYPLGSYR